jgi:plasmid stability protein
MPGITIRKLEDELKTRLRVYAAHHGGSMEDEARDILRVALSSEIHTSHDLVESIRRRFTAIGEIELDLPLREPIREPPAAGQ